jgi:glycosyltransferase involved in cell wall biosynthesis
MKILIASATYYPDVNGASYFTQRLTYYLKKKGHEVLVIAPSRTIHHEISQHEGVSVFGVRSYPILVYQDFRFAPAFFTKKAIKKAIQEFNPDIIHTQSHFLFCAEVVAIAKELKIPIIGTNHFMPENLVHYFPLPEFLRNAIKNFGWWQFRRVYDKVDLVTAPTQTAADLTKKSGLAKNIIPISNGIDMERFNPQNKGEYLRKKYLLPSSPLLITVGRLDKEKNIDMLLRALKLVPNNIDLHFAIVGKGAEKANLEKLARKLGIADRVTFLGFVPDDELPGLYSISSCFINGCIAELQCIAAMEGMASGLPVILANVLALPELVQQGENGFLFEVGEYEKIAGYISRIFSEPDLRKKMSEKSLELIKKHDINNVISQFESLYANLL